MSGWIDRMRAGVQQRRREQRYAGGRAGAASQDFAQRRLDAFVRANARELAISVAVFAALGVALWFLLFTVPEVRGFALGFYLAGVAGALYHWCSIASGAALSVMGQSGEEWTHSELRRLRKRGWRIINHALLGRGGDVDHIAIGPDGVIVIETKWTSSVTDLGRRSDWLDSAMRQARTNERNVARMLGWAARRDARITALLVVWGPRVTQPGDEPLLVDGMNVLAGEHLRRTLADLGDEHLGPEQVDAIYDKLLRTVASRDRHEAEHRDPRPPTLAELAQRWTIRVLVGFGGALLAALAVNIGWWFFAAAAAFVALGLLGRRVEVLAPYAGAWLVGTQAITVLVLLALVIERL